MRNKIIGGFAMLWGGAILIHWAMADKPAVAAGNSAYRAGQTGALIWAGLMLVAGFYSFFKKPS